MYKGGGEYQDFLSTKLSHSAEKFRRGIFYRLISFRYREMLRIKERGGGGVSRFSAENFLSHSAQYFVGQPFCAVFQNFSGSEKVCG